MYGAQLTPVCIQSHLSSSAGWVLRSCLEHRGERCAGSWEYERCLYFCSPLFSDETASFFLSILPADKQVNLSVVPRKEDAWFLLQAACLFCFTLKCLWAWSSNQTRNGFWKCNVLSTQSAWISLPECGSVAHWVLQQDLEIWHRLWSWYSGKWVGENGLLYDCHEACLFYKFPDQSWNLPGWYYSGTARAVIATISGTPNGLKATCLILLTLSYLYKFPSGSS